MIYKILKWIMKLTVNSYFRRITVKGKDLIPAAGPVIFIANHPSAFMDPIVIASIVKRSIHFISAGEFMGRGLKEWIYRTQFNMVPVFRPVHDGNPSSASVAEASAKATEAPRAMPAGLASPERFAKASRQEGEQDTAPDDTSKNAEMFSKCFELLASGGTILIFPEGNSVTEKRLRKLKTGVARMAIGARAFSPEIDVTVVPIGLNYTNPHRFQSDLFINIGEPVVTRTYSMEKTDVVQLTSDLEQGLKKTLLHIQDEELDPLVKKVQLVLKHDLKKTHTGNRIEAEQEFHLQQRVIASVQGAHDDEPGAMAQIEQKLDDYLNKIRELEISDGAIASPSVMVNALEVLKLIVGMPLFIAGFVINAIPYYSTVLIFRRLNLFQREGAPEPKTKVNPAFRGSIGLVIGMVLFLSWYLAWAAFAIWMSGIWWIAAPVLVVFYVSGLFCLHYINWMINARQKRKFRFLLSNESHLFATLLLEREEIINALKKITSDTKVTLNTK